MVRAVSELVNVGDSAWPSIQAAAAASVEPVVVLPVDRKDGEECLYRLQVTTRSALGALALNCGGIVVGHGWLRLLGGGYSSLPDLASANGLGAPTDSGVPPPYLEVARDVLGGRFAINGGALPGVVGGVCYLAPDTLGWEPLGTGHGDFVAWAFGAGVERFYDEFRWTGWESEVEPMALDQGLSIYPPLFSQEARDLASTSRRPVPWSELVGFYDQARRDLGDAQDGQRFRVTRKD